MMGYYGKNYYFDNIGKMTNKGVELSAVWNDLRANWGYSINGSVSFNRNKSITWPRWLRRTATTPRRVVRTGR